MSSTPRSEPTAALTPALDELIDRVEFARSMGGAIPVTDALVQLLAAAVVDLAKEVRDA